MQPDPIERATARASSRRLTWMVGLLFGGTALYLLGAPFLARAAPRNHYDGTVAEAIRTILWPAARLYDANTTYERYVDWALELFD